MWFLAILTILNAVLKQYSFINVNRLQIGILQIGVVEILLLVGLVWAALRGSVNRARFPTPVSPTFIGLMLILVVGITFGVLGSLRNDIPLKDMLSGVREFGAIPICIFVGYSLISDERATRRYALLSAIAGVLTAALLLASFGENTEKANLTNNINPLRGIIIDFNSEYAAISALFLVYCVVMGLKLMPRVIMILLAVFCFIGYLCTLSRTSSLVMSFGVLTSYFLLPRGKRIGGMLKAAIFGVVIGFSVFGALLVADAIVGRNFIGKVETHFESALPGAETGHEPKAYEARFAAYQVELGIWLDNPLMGSGFGIQEAMLRRGQLPEGPAYNHNGVTTLLCKTGIFGFAGCFGTILVLIFVGWRMNRQATDVNELIIGGLGFLTGIVFFVRACCTMAFTNRAALCFALTAGVLLRAREMQRAKIAALRDYLPQSPEHLADQLEWEYAPEYGSGHVI